MARAKQEINSEEAKMAKIANVMAMMEETHKTKEWLVKQVKSSRFKVNPKLSMNSLQILSKCPDELVDDILENLKGADIDHLGDISTLTKTYHWFFTDIVAGSNPTLVTKDQVRKIMVLNELIKRTETFKNRDKENTIILPTGDGMAIGFPEYPELPLRLAIQLHKALNKYNEKKRKKDKVLLRIGIDTGPVYIIKDLKDQDNVWGPGIIMTRRVMDFGNDNQILASSRIGDDIKNLSPEYKDLMHPIGDYSTKHEEKLEIYNIYGDDFGNKIPPRKSKILKEKPKDEDLLGIHSFEFRNIDVEIEVIDTKTMLTHHTWIWDVFNISKEPRDQIFYYLDGDTPKDFPDMNVKVTDRDGNELDIVSLGVNKPMHKEFNVKLKKPIPPRRGLKQLKLEYDWEEPERNFFYKLATDCKRFRYKFTIPSNVRIKNRILKVDTEMGYKWHVSPPPVMKFKDDKTIITWEGKNLKAHSAYRFEW